ncbi:hypothetical protein M2102_000515 [Fusobacterium sp. PH5-7]|uniref:gp53-like domain-containing protein n=1 Tax=Fusobacterium sp. PH5-7 TaxID=2940528 RepID=UPI002473B543|nr:hypothetical protein [Fusobacterium sp. PH5-7]MDH6456900.1 hypothetical protein [Fusobacterium sp. PH5-7]
MKYNGFTNAGSMYQAKCKANELPIKFVKVKIGNGLLEETEDPAKFIDVKSLKKEVGISEKTQIQDAVRLTIQMDNDGVTEGYFPREFGIYVEDEGVEVLYWYVNDGNEASYLPTQSTAPVKLKNHFNIIATSLESLVVNWSGKEFWIDKEYLEKELEKKQDMTDSRLLTTAKTIWESINELFTKKANKDDVENNLITVDEGKILDARQGPAIVNKINGLAGGYSGIFPLTTAVKEGIYLLPATNKFYVCVENYSGSSLTAPNANFEELSVFQNRNKLENLCIFDTGSTSTAAWAKLPNGLLIQWSTASVWGTFTYPKAFKDINYVLIPAYGNSSINWTPNGSSPTMFKVSTTQGNIYSSERVRGYWLAIGY